MASTQSPLNINTLRGTVNTNKHLIQKKPYSHFWEYTKRIENKFSKRYL